jgi:DNA-binding transcriptional MerR regulator
VLSDDERGLRKKRLESRLVSLHRENISLLCTDSETVNSTLKVNDMVPFADQSSTRLSDDFFGREKTTQPPDFLFIGELASKLNLNPKTIRFYEKEGLIKPSRHGSFRTFLRDDVLRLGSIVMMRRLGMSIAVLKALYVGNEGEPQKKYVLSTLKDHLSNLKRQKIILENQLSETASYVEMLENESQISHALAT